MNGVVDTKRGPWYCFAHRDTYGWKLIGSPQKRFSLLYTAICLLDSMTSSTSIDEYRVLGASSKDRLEDMLHLLKEGKPTIAISLKSFIDGNVPDKCITSWEYVLVKEGFINDISLHHAHDQAMRETISLSFKPDFNPAPITAEEQAKIQRRLEFLRWLYTHGKLTDR